MNASMQTSLYLHGFMQAPIDSAFTEPSLLTSAFPESPNKKLKYQHRSFKLLSKLKAHCWMKLGREYTGAGMILLLVYLGFYMP